MTWGLHTVNEQTDKSGKNLGTHFDQFWGCLPETDPKQESIQRPLRYCEKLLKARGRLALLGQGDFAMADEEEQTQSGSGGDPRLEFIETYVKRTLKIKQDKWMKFMSNEEARQVLMDYFEKPEITYLVVYLNSSNQLAASDGFPGSSKNKAVYFVKHGKIALSKENLHSGLSFGDLSYAPLDQLSAVVENVST